MPRPLSFDLRERLARAVSGGSSRNAAAKKFEVSVGAVIKLLQRWKATGSYMPAQIGGYRKPLLAAHVDRVHGLLAEKPDMSIAELQKRLAVAGVRVGQSSISRFPRQLGYTYKKTVHAAEQDRPDVKLARAVWRTDQPGLDPQRLVFVDETGAATTWHGATAAP
jgi:transposase